MVLIILFDPTGADPGLAIARETVLAFMRLIQRKPQEIFRICVILGPYLGSSSPKGRRVFQDYV